MKIRKDKTNTAVYNAMKKAQKNPYVFSVINSLDSHLETHRKGFDLDYLKTEHQLNLFFTHMWKSRIPQLKDKFGDAKAKEMIERLMKLFYCKGLALNQRHSHQCHHPLCPLCYHRKHYRTLYDLKPYLKSDNRLSVLRLSEAADYDQLHMVMDALETRAKKITTALSPNVEQWSRQAHLYYDEEQRCFIASAVIAAIHKETKEEAIKGIVADYEEYRVESRSIGANMGNMENLICSILAYDPLVVKYAGSKGFGDWDLNSPYFKYRAKHAHKRTKET